MKNIIFIVPESSMKKLPLSVKIGYGMAELGIIGLETLLRLYLLIFYTDQVGLKPYLAGTALAVAVLWDAFTDPLLGTISDRTATRWGKRRPFILLGGILLPIFTVLLFHPPTMETQASKFSFLLVSYILLNTCITILAIPHSALGAEMTNDRDERSELYGWRFLFATLGALLVAISPTSEAIAIVIFVTSIISFIATKGHDDTKNEETPPLWEFSIEKIRLAIRSIWKNKIFVLLLISYIVANIGLAINSAIALYYYKYRLLLTEEQTKLVIGLFLAVVSFSIAGWVMLSRKWGKKKPTFWGIFGLAIMTIFSYPFFPSKNLLLPLGAACLGGILVGATALLESIVADSIDYDEFYTGKQREGLYFGLWKMGGKISRAISIIVCGMWLQYIGFVPNAEQSADVSEKLGWMFGWGVGIFLLVAAIIFSFMPYSDEKHKEIQRALLERRNE